MFTKKRVALVTGSNRGIGKEICQQLTTLEIEVILTARHETDGQAAAEDISRTTNSEPPLVVQLDVSDTQSISKTANEVKNRLGRLDILVNNAGILIDENNSILTIDPDIIQRTLETNLFGALRTVQTFIPLMERNAYGRIVNVSSGMGAFNEMNGGYPGYRISKTALNAMTKIFAAELGGTDILINTMCPGWVRTDMGGSVATRSVETGADTAIWLATLPKNGPSGKFFRDRNEIQW